MNETENEQQTVSANDVYEFHYGSNPGLYQELEVRINNDLLGVAEGYLESRVFDSVIISAGEHPENQCSVRFDFDYAEGVREPIEGDGWEKFYSTYGMERSRVMI